MTDYTAPPAVETPHKVEHAAASSASGVTSAVNSLFDFIGSANVQKAIGLAFAALTANGGQGLEQWSAGKVAGVTIGTAFTVAVHALDAIRAKIGR